MDPANAIVIRACAAPVVAIIALAVTGWLCRRGDAGRRARDVAAGARLTAIERAAGMIEHYRDN